MIVDTRTGEVLGSGVSSGADGPVLHGEVVALRAAAGLRVRRRGHTALVRSPCPHGRWRPPHGPSTPGAAPGRRTVRPHRPSLPGGPAVAGARTAGDAQGVRRHGRAAFGGTHGRAAFGGHTRACDGCSAQASARHEGRQARAGGEGTDGLGDLDRAFRAHRVRRVGRVHGEVGLPGSKLARGPGGAAGRPGAARRAAPRRAP
ncbi:hypothetical protein [Streptomyces sp. NBC_00481]|uniref:hypothetical protein n=1 Tax=unclassified Streptomyces TaxID=2593676 RepID=UPI003FA39A28